MTAPDSRTVVITLTWPETEPGYGFSYTDADGVEHRFAISSNPDAADDVAPELVDEPIDEAPAEENGEQQENVK